MRTKQPIKQLSLSQLEKRISRLSKSVEWAEHVLELAYRVRGEEVKRALQLIDSVVNWSQTVENHELLVRSLRLKSIVTFQIIGDVSTAAMLIEEAQQLRTYVYDDNVLLELDSTRADVLYLQGRESEALEFMQRNVQRSRVIKNVLVEISSLSNISTLLSRANRIEESIPIFHQTIDLLQQHPDTSKLAAVYNNLGSAYSYLNNIDEAFRCFFRSKELRKQLNEKSNLASTLLNLAHLYSSISDFSSSLSELTDAEQLLENSGNERLIAGVQLFFGEVLVHQKQYQSAVDYYEKALRVFEKQGQVLRCSIVNLALSELYAQLGRNDDAIRTIEHEFTKKEIQENNQLLISTYITYGSLLLQLNRAEQAASELEKAFQHEGIDSDTNSSLIVTLCKAYVACGMHNKAIELSQKLFNTEYYKQVKDDYIQVLELLVEVYSGQKLYKKAFETSQELLQVTKEVYNINSNHKVQTLLFQLDLQRAKKDMELANLKAEHLEKELDMKTKELNLLALHLVNKNEFLSDIRNQISDNIDDSNEFIKQLSQTISNTAEDDAEWHRFEKQFTQINPTFAARLQDISGGTLSVTEMRICSLVKTGLSSQEIANILFLSKRTIETHRYNIQKKLKCGKVKLATFLTQIS